MASRNFGNVKAAAVKRHPGSNITGVTNFERGLQLLRTPQRSQTPLSRLARTFSTARSQALGGAAGSLETRDADYVGGVAGTCTGSESLRRLVTAACSARAACLPRSRPPSSSQRCCTAGGNEQKGPPASVFMRKTIATVVILGL